MAQSTDYVLSNQSGASFRAELNTILAAIASANSEATEPATMYPFMLWADTSSGLLKIRNAANSAWIEVGTLASANLGLATAGANSSITSLSGLTTPLSVDQGGTGLDNIPAFSAYANTNQSVTSSVFTKVTLGTEIYDTNNNFTASRFTPTVAGYYLITGVLRGNATSLQTIVASVYKNGASYRQGGTLNIAAITSSQQVVVSEILFLNGSTDYVELYGAVTGTTPIFQSASSDITSSFTGLLVRAA
jgi:hypothetical protein